MEINDEVDFNAVEEQIRNATDIFGDIAHFIDTEAENYRMSQILNTTAIHGVCVFLFIELHDKVETEFEDAYLTLRYDYLNSINDSINEVST